MRKHMLIVAFAALLACSAAQAEVFVRIGPPPPRPVEVIPVRPHPGWVWVPGYHRWDGRAYVWVPGYYVAPPRPRAYWVPGRWVPRRGGWMWVEGHWRY